MNREKAIVQIGDLMQQVGIPANHAADIVRRLRTAVGIGGSRKGSRLLTSADARNSSFFNKFKADEQDAQPNIAERAGEDGLPGADGWGAQGPNGAGGPPGMNGLNGLNGADGESPDVGDLLALIQAMIASLIGGLNIDLGRVSCRSFKDKFRECITEDDLRPLTPEPVPPTCNGASVCSILRQIARRLGNCGTDGRSFCDRLKDLDKRLKAVEKAINQDTVEC